MKYESLTDVKNCLLRMESDCYFVFGVEFSVTVKKPNIFQE